MQWYDGGCIARWSTSRGTLEVSCEKSQPSGQLKDLVVSTVGAQATKKMTIFHGTNLLALGGT
jgi:hypothetical protein